MLRHAEPPEWHILDFFSDEGGDCALTAFVRGVRIHIMADSDKLPKDTTIGAKFRSLFQAFQSKETEGQNPRQQSPKSTDSDSGVDVKGPDDKSNGEINDQDAETALQRWMFAPIAKDIDTLVPSSPRSQTIEEWYHCPVRYFELCGDKTRESLEAIELESTSELEKQMQDLLPELVLPKYITNTLDVPTYCGSDLSVLDASEQPVGTPYHPCRVQDLKSKDTFFLKVVDKNQPQAIKRELDVLRQIESSRLHEQIRVPLLQGLVSFDKAEATPAGKTKIMGFLLTDIPNPKPLTNMFDTAIPKPKRDRWAEEARQMKEHLHENEIVWGDAKGDNFMVDEEDDLWIIDFGGSYTEGWVDPELNETEAGDDMGTEKVINALEDPVANVEDPDEDEDHVEVAGSAKQQGKKRCIDDADEEEAGLDRRPAKSNRS